MKSQPGNRLRAAQAADRHWPQPTALVDHVSARVPRLLLVDDDRLHLKSLSALLRAAGYEATPVDSACGAMQKLQGSEFDLVLLDLRMPGQGGNAVMEHIQTASVDVAVIVVSGESRIDAAIGALRRRADDFVRKPYLPADLLRSIEHTLQRRRLLIENRSMAQQLEHSERLYRHLVDSSPDMIYMLDAQGRFTFVNDRFESLLGIERDSLIGRHYSSVIQDDDLPAARYVFHERRVGDRAARNVELRLRPLSLLPAQPDASSGFKTLLFNSVAMYGPTMPLEGGGASTYGGTYGVARDLTERKRAEERISHQAYHDILTDLPNRILFRDRLEVAMLQAMRSGCELAVMFIDLDRFKMVNDTLGHLLGDDLLKEAASRLKDVLRAGDTLARLGGDEFIIMLPRLGSREDAAVVARKILECLQFPFVLAEHEVRISASIGISVYPVHGTTIDQLLAHADIAMYRVKADGKNGHCFFRADMLDASQYKLSLDRGLRLALERGELEMFYQPQIDVRTGRIIGAEGLMRWRHPDRGLLTASEFLPFAEEVGLIVPISDWMLETVCRDLSEWTALGADDVTLAINLSPQYLERGDFVRKLVEAQGRWGFAMSRIEVEITENVSIRNPQHVIDQLNMLCRLGVSVAIDDFGTGYASLAYLHRFPIRTVKIDQSFVREILHAQGHCPVVLAIISMATGLGMNVIAEGVETTEESAYLEQAGCPRMQGFLFYSALANAEFMSLLAEQTAGRRPASWHGHHRSGGQGRLLFES